MEEKCFKESTENVLRIGQKLQELELSLANNPDAKARNFSKQFTINQRCL